MFVCLFVGLSMGLPTTTTMGLPNDNNSNDNNDNNNNKLKTTGLLDNNTAPTLTMPAPASLVNTVDCMPALKALNSFDRIGAKRLPNFIISIIEAMVRAPMIVARHVISPR